MLKTLEDLVTLARERKKNPVEGSYTNKLLEDETLSKVKVLEEIDELIESVEKNIKMAEEEGAKIIIDGRDFIKRKNSNNGYFLGPTVIDQVNTKMQSYKNEIFGPVLQVMEMKNVSEGIRIINNNDFGNGCCIFTSDGHNARLFADKAEIGMVGINIPLPVPSAYHSFGGWKNSIFGDLNIYGPDGVRFYTQRKTITQKWPSSEKSTGIDLSMPNNLKQ